MEFDDDSPYVPTETFDLDLHGGFDEANTIVIDDSQDNAFAAPFHQQPALGVEPSDLGPPVSTHLMPYSTGSVEDDQSDEYNIHAPLVRLYQYSVCRSLLTCLQPPTNVNSYPMASTPSLGDTPITVPKSTHTSSSPSQPSNPNLPILAFPNSLHS